MISGGSRPLAKEGGGGGLDFLALLAFFPSVISSFFTQNKGDPGPTLRDREKQNPDQGA